MNPRRESARGEPAAGAGAGSPRREPARGEPAAGAGAGSPRRELAIAVLGTVAGAGLALFAATRTWSVEVVARPEPLPAIRIPHAGPAWTAALAVVALAGAGALVATRGAARTAIGVLLVAAGLGLAVGGATDVPRPWPALTIVGGLAVAAVGALAVRRGGGWPGMGVRYDRAKSPPPDDLWAALDRGEDPTA